MTLVLRDDKDGVTTLTLNRPEKLNTLTVALFQELNAHVLSIQNDKDVRVVVLRGAGKCFSAGNDLTAIGGPQELPEPYFQPKVIERLAELPLPVISAVHGHCYTGGLELALAADIIFASANAKFADTHGRYALLPRWGLTQRLPRRVGTYKAREMMFTARTYSGADAAVMGLANFCVADADFESELTRLTSDIASNSPHSHAGYKRLLMQTDGMSLKEGLAHEVYRGEGIGPDVRERIAAFTNRAKR